MKLSIIIVNYNTERFLINCLESLFVNYRRYFRNHKFEIIVVDNGSKNLHVLKKSKYLSQIRLIRNKKNFGFSRANNIGIKKAHGEYVLLLNPDTLVYKHTLTRLLVYLDNHPDCAVATCKVILPNGEIDDASHRGFPTPWRAFTYFLGLGKLLPFSKLFNGYHLGYQDMDIIHEIDACVGAFLMIRYQVGKQIKWLDQDYFWYGDDLDLCFRVKKLGYKIIYIPDTSIMHYKGISSGLKKHSRYLSSADKKTRVLATKSRYEVMRIFYKKHYLGNYPQWLTNLVFWGISVREKINQIKI